MKFALLLSAFSSALLVAGVPVDSKMQGKLEDLEQQCANFELSCCSNLRSSNEGTQDIDGTVIPIAVSVGGEITQTLQSLTQLSILSGCSPLIGSAQIECVNYIACCVPEEENRRRGGHEKEGDHHRSGRANDDRQCKILKDTSVRTDKGLVHV